VAEQSAEELFHEDMHGPRFLKKMGKPGRSQQQVRNPPFIYVGKSKVKVRFLPSIAIRRSREPVVRLPD